MTERSVRGVYSFRVIEVKPDTTDKMITHEQAREIAKKNLHWGERKPMLDYITQQEQRDKDVTRYFELNDK